MPIEGRVQSGPIVLRHIVGRLRDSQPQSAFRFLEVHNGLKMPRIEPILVAPLDEAFGRGLELLVDPEEEVDRKLLVKVWKMQTKKDQTLEQRSLRKKDEPSRLLA